MIQLMLSSHTYENHLYLYINVFMCCFQSVIGWPPAYKNSISSQLDIDGLTTWLDPGQARLMQVNLHVKLDIDGLTTC